MKQEEEPNKVRTFFHTLSERINETSDCFFIF